MTDMLIRDVGDEIVARINAETERRNISRQQLLLEVIERAFMPVQVVGLQPIGYRVTCHVPECEQMAQHLVFYSNQAFSWRCNEHIEI